MKISEVMTAGLDRVEPEDSLLEAARMMKMLSVGGLPVMKDDSVVGFLTDRDVVVRGVAEGADPHGTKVEEVMTPKPIAVYQDEDLEAAARVMRSNEVRRLIVIDRLNHPVGVLSVEDMAVAGPEGRHAGNVLKSRSRRG